jgi:hypothetical protein
MNLEINMLSEITNHRQQNTTFLVICGIFTYSNDADNRNNNGR